MRIALAALAVVSLTAPAHADCIGDLKAVLTGSLSAGPYVMELTTDQMTMAAEMVPPNAMHSKTVMPEMTQEMTVLDGKAWMKMGEAWTAMPDAMATQMTAAFTGAAGMMDQVTSAECLGTQNLEGKDYLAFKYDFDIAGAQTTSTLYVDPATRLPAIVIGSATMGGTTTDTRATYRYDPSIIVSAPM